MRLTLRVGAIAGSLLVLVPLHYLWLFAGRRSPWPRRFLAFVGWTAGLRVRSTGIPLTDHVLFVSNHLSWLDIMLIAGSTGAAFVSRDDVAGWPVIGWLASLNRTIFVARADRNSVRGQADALRDALADGRPIALFPEGTTEGGEAVLPFRASLLAALVPPIAGVRVQPVAIDYGDAAREIAWIGEESAGANAKRVLSRRGTIEVSLYFLDPIDPRAFPDRKRIAEISRAEIVAALDRVHESSAGAVRSASDAAADRL